MAKSATFDRVITERSPEGFRIRHIRQFARHVGDMPTFEEFVQADCLVGDHHYRVAVGTDEVPDVDMAVSVVRDGLARYIEQRNSPTKAGEP